MYPPFYPKRRWLQYWLYRIKNGFFPCDCWNLDHELAVWLVPRLKLFKINNHGYPYEFTSEQWDAILDEMIEGFSLKIREWDTWIDELGDKRYFLTDKEEEKVTRAFSLLGQYGQHLWD